MKAKQNDIDPANKVCRLFYARKGRIPGSFLPRQDSRALKQLSRGFFILVIQGNSQVIKWLLTGLRIICAGVIIQGSTTTKNLFRSERMFGCLVGF